MLSGTGIWNLRNVPCHTLMMPSHNAAWSTIRLLAFGTYLMRLIRTLTTNTHIFLILHHQHDTHEHRPRFNRISRVCSPKIWSQCTAMLYLWIRNRVTAFQRNCSLLFLSSWEQKYRVPWVALYWGYFIVLWLFGVSCTAVILTCFVRCGWVYVGVFGQLCGCFGKICTCIFCIFYCLFRVFVLFRLCIFILICFACTSVRTTAIEWKIDCGK